MKSIEYLQSADKMIKEAKENFEKGNLTSEISYIHSAIQDLQNALYHARSEHSEKDILEFQRR